MVVAQKEAHGSVYTLINQENGTHVVRRQAINPETGKPWQRIWTLGRFTDERGGFQALALFNRAVKNGIKS